MTEQAVTPRRPEHILARVVEWGMEHRPAFESLLAGCVILGGSSHLLEPLSSLVSVGKGQQLLQDAVGAPGKKGCRGYR